MARLPRRLVRQRTAGGNGKDRLSALPDELIHLIVSRLDTRTALSTAVLGRRWARIPRDLPALDLRVSDILPAEYHRTFALRQGKSRRVQELAGELDNLLALFEDIMMESLAAGITGLLEADGHGGGSDGDACRRVKTVRLDFFFRTHDDVGCIERLIAAAVGAWGVEDLEVVAYPSATCHDHDAPAYGFPHDRLDGGGRSRLRSLTLGNCTLPPLRTYEALRTLVLQGVAASTPVAVYERLFTDCARLQTLHLKSCGCTEELDHLEVDAPCSSLTELVVEDCAFSAITLHDLPALTRLACQDSSASVMLTFGSVPSLTHVNLTFWGSERPDDFLGNAPDATTSLVLRFTGPARWVLPRHVATPFRGLKRLLVADVPPNWDVSWPRILLLSARSLEALHIHVALPHSDEDEEPGEEIIWWQRPKLRHRHMKELVMVGFTGTPRQTQYLRDLVKVCRSLQRLVLLRDGHVQYNGRWDWKMVGKQQECPRRRRWSDDDEMAVKRMIKSRSRAHLEVILG